MFLSIIIPIYNDEKFLFYFLDSCLEQDYPQDDYEIICIDDGSTDRTPEMLREYAASNPNIRLIFKEHTGKGGRSVGFEQAQGDFIWFVDHDDIVAPNAVPDLKAAVEANPGIGRIQFPYYQFFDKLTDEELHRFQDGTLLPNDEDRLRDYVIWDSIYQLSFLKDHQINPRSNRIAQAGAYWSIANFGVFGGDTVFVEECLDKGVQTFFLEGRPLYHYRRHNQTETMNYSPERVKWREELKYHTVLLNLYLALQNKEAYLKQRREKGAADEETTVRAVVSLRKAASALANLPTQYWREGMKLACGKQAFFPKRIPEYSFSYRQYMKLKTRAERLKPETTAQYYTYTESGTRLFRFLTTFGRVRNDIVAWEKLKNVVIKSENRRKGTANK